MADGNIIRIEEIGAKKLDRISALLKDVPSGAIKASHWAIKRAAQTMTTQAARYVSAKYNIKQKDFRANTKIKTKVTGTSSSVTSVTITYAGCVLPLKTFATKGGKAVTTTSGISVSVKRGSSETLNHAFIVEKFENNIFERTGRQSYPIEKLFGPSTPHMLSDGDIVQQMASLAEDTFNSRVEHEITRILNGW